MCGSSPLSMTRLSDLAQPVDGDPDDVAGAQEQSAAGADPGRRTGRDDVAGFERDDVLAAATSWSTGQIMSEVDSSCCRSPLTHRRSRSSWGSGTCEAGVMPGPSGSELSIAFAANQS